MIRNIPYAMLCYAMLCYAMLYWNFSVLSHINRAKSAQYQVFVLFNLKWFSKNISVNKEPETKISAQLMSLKQESGDHGEHVARRVKRSNTHYTFVDHRVEFGPDAPIHYTDIKWCWNYTKSQIGEKLHNFMVFENHSEEA